ncbi:MAG: RNA polymerase recycling motor ATPase HelR, partial [Gordonia sp. (in: high G+C Gram-positive bacteria)]
PAAEPFFAATPAHPRGVAARRRYRWGMGRVVDYWDEVLINDGPTGPVALDEDSALLATLRASRSPRMRDVLGTIAADQDAIIRADSHGTLVVDGGPGTGKTVVALHRAAYLLYADPRLGGNRGRLLVIGPHQPYLAYISDVLPGLGEEGVQTATLTDLVPEGATATVESDPAVARIKAGLDPLDVIDRAAAFYEAPPREPLLVETPWDEVTLTADDWARAFDAPDSGTPHNEARDAIWNELTEIIADGHDASVDLSALRKALAQNRSLQRAVGRSWPVLDAPTLVGDLWSVPAFARLCAPGLSREEISLVQRADPTAWTRADLPLLDAAHARLGDPGFSRRQREREARLAADRAEMDDVVTHLLHAHTYDDGEGLASMLRQEDLREVLVDEAAVERRDPDLLAGPFAHIVVDEAQELTAAEWSMVLSRCPSRSLTVVGDRAQARHGFAESWVERLEDVGLRDIRVTHLTLNYRTPEEIMAAAAPVIRAALPDANVPTSIRTAGIDVTYGGIAGLAGIVDGWLATHDSGIACVIGDSTYVPPSRRVRSLPAEQVKGLEFDLVVLARPDDFGTGVTGAVDRYVAMTRATQQLVVLT